MGLKEVGMYKGKLVFSRDVFDNLSNEVDTLIKGFVGLGEVESLVYTPKEYIYTLKHPDFIEYNGDTPPSYLLHLVRKYDTVTNSERPYISKLTVCSDGIKYRVVRKYA